MVSNHEEYSNDKTLENLKWSVQIYWGSSYLCRKSEERICFGVVRLAFSYFL